jgi:PPOX class probable F420-dependent enzyme
MALPENVTKLFKDKNYGIVTTLRQDGTPHSTPVWIDSDGERVMFNTAVGRAKERHLRKNPWVSITVLPSENLQSGYVVVYGKAVGFDESEKANEHIDAMAQKYLGEAKYPWLAPDEQRVIIEIEPERYDGFGAGAVD